MYNIHVLINMLYLMHTCYFTDTLGYQGYVYSRRQEHAMNIGLQV